MKYSIQNISFLTESDKYNSVENLTCALFAVEGEAK